MIDEVIRIGTVHPNPTDFPPGTRLVIRHIIPGQKNEDLDAEVDCYDFNNQNVRLHLFGRIAWYPVDRIDVRAVCSPDNSVCSSMYRTVQTVSKGLITNEQTDMLIAAVNRLKGKSHIDLEYVVEIMVRGTELSYINFDRHAFRESCGLNPDA